MKPATPLNKIAEHGLPPLWVRLAHWTNAAAFFVMIFSGWQVYNADPFWIDGFPDQFALGGSLPGALQWHFAAMWLLAGNGVITLLLLTSSGRLRQLYLSINIADLPAQIRRFFTNPLLHENGKRNIVQKMAYTFVLLLLSIEIASGLAMWKPVQLQLLSTLLGGYENTRRIHFIGMSSLGLFVTGHIALALLSPRLLLGMLGIHKKHKPTSEES